MNSFKGDIVYRGRVANSFNKQSSHQKKLFKKNKQKGLKVKEGQSIM